MAATVNRAVGPACAPEGSFHAESADLGGVRSLAATAERVLEGLCDGTIEAAPDAVAAIAESVERLKAALDAVAGAEARQSRTHIAAEFERARTHLQEASRSAEDLRPFDRLARLAGELEVKRAAPAPTRINALIVECAGALVAMPARSVVGVLKGAHQRIEHADGALFLRARGRVLKIAPLADLLKLGAAKERKDEGCIVVARTGGAAFGLLADRFLGAEEVAVAPGSPSRLFSGAAVLGGGATVALLDMKGLAAAAEAARFSGAPYARAAEEAADRVALLVIRGVGGVRQAAPLSIVARIETAEELECLDGRWMAAQRGRLVPVLDSEGRSIKPPDGAPLIIFVRDGREIALAAEDVLEVAESFADAPLSYAGGNGGLTIDGRATELVDVNLLWRAAQTHAAPGVRSALIMDRGAFGAVHVAPILTRAGYEVAVEADPAAALARHDRGERFDLILVDAGDASRIVAALRCARDWQGVPVLAFDRAAFDADALLAAAEEALVR